MSVIKRNQPKGAILKIGQRKLRSDVNWQGALKNKGVKNKRKTGWVQITCINTTPAYLQNKSADENVQTGIYEV